MKNLHKVLLGILFLGGVAGVYGLALATPPEFSHAAVCHPGAPGEAYCHAHVVTDAHGKPFVSLSPTGFGPDKFHGAYASATSSGSSQIIALVDAYHYSTAYNDLTNYSNIYGIPVLPQCDGANPYVSSNKPCFSQVNQLGGTSYPAVNSGWALEAALDIESAHAMCQNCSILLVESNSASMSDLAAAENRAATLHATEISNSWGAKEFTGETTFDSAFNHPGIAITVSSGDGGYKAGAQYPAAVKTITSVGGTRLTMLGTSYVSESAWTGAGSGCSKFETKPSFQHDASCAKRAISDVSADADPFSGASVYDTTGAYNGWYTVGGTSLSSPLIAGIFGLAGGVAGDSYGVSIPYTHTGSFHDVTSGKTGNCGNGYICTAKAGYDGPTGLGTPNGLGGF